MVDVVIGSDPARCDIVFEQPTVSSTHCRLSREQTVEGVPALFITDLSSTNGTWVDGAQIASERPTRVFLGAYISLGHQVGFELGAQHLYPSDPYATARSMGLMDRDRPPPDDLLSPGELVGNGAYVVLGWQADGGMGVVYRARHAKTGEDVALKILRAEVWSHPTARKRMEREADVLARVSHPNVVRLIDVFDTRGLLTLALAYLPGGDLESKLESGPLPVDSAVRIAVRVLAGLQAMHDAGLVHRDIKPSNILLDAEGRPCIADLGIAHDATGRGMTRHGARLGTPEYMAPEQHKGEAVSVAVDVYAVGLLLHRMIVGKLPWQAETDFDWAVAHAQHPPRLSEFEALAGRPLTRILKRALAKDPKARWKIASQMAEQLAEAQWQQDGEQLPTQAGSDELKSVWPGEGGEPAGNRYVWLGPAFVIMIIIIRWLTK